jgi:hypothetical protein
MELSIEELRRKQLQGKLKILKESKRILDELYWKNVKEERELLNNWDESVEKSIEELQKKRQEIIKEINEINDQLGL